MTSGEISLTFPASCAVCRASIPLGTRVWWDADTSDITCVGTHLATVAAPTTPGLFDQDRADDTATTPGSWNLLDVDSPNWWSSFDPSTAPPPAAPTSPPPAPVTSVAAPVVPVVPAVAEPVVPVAVEPVVTVVAAEPVVPVVAEPVVPVVPAVAQPIAPVAEAGPAPMVAPPEPYEPEPAPIPAPEPARRVRRRTGFTTVLTPGGIAGLPAAHRRTRVRAPQSTWGPSSMLNLGLGRSVVVLDRRSADGAGHIDHVVVAQSGVWVLTIKQSRGLVEKRAGGTMSQPRERLLVNGRERTRALRSALLHARDVEMVVARMGNGWDRVPVRAVLCFVDAEWRPFAQPFEVDDVTVVWPKALGGLVHENPLIAARSVDALAAHLDGALPRV